MTASVQVFYEGNVQGVGFRWSVRQIANALELPETELAAVWRQLPLDDAAIAGRFNSTLQQVINLRKLARSRLSRRMAV